MQVKRMENGEGESVMEELESLSTIIAADMQFLTVPSMNCTRGVLHRLLQSPFGMEANANSLRVSIVAIRLASSLYRRDPSSQSTDDVIQCFDLLKQQIESFQKSDPHALLGLYTADEYWSFLSLFWRDGRTPSAFQFAEKFHYLFLNSFTQALRHFSAAEREMILNALTCRSEASTFVTVYIIQLLIVSLSSSSSSLFLVSLYYHLLRLAPHHCFQSPQPDFSSVLLSQPDTPPQSLLDWWEATYSRLTDNNGEAANPSSAPRGKLEEMRDKLMQLVLSSVMWTKLLDRVASVAVNLNRYANPDCSGSEESQITLHQFCLLLGVLFSSYGISTASPSLLRYP